MTANARHSSATAEHYTPEWLVEKARHTLGGIDLDPASSAFANEVVRATTYYTEEQNGLLVPGGWRGRTFLNCPGGLVDSSGNAVHRSTRANPGGCTVTGSCGLPPSPHADSSGFPPGHKHEGVTSSAVTWWRALCGEWRVGHVTAAIFIGFSIELLQSCQKGENPGHHPLDFPCCFPKDRIPFDVVRDGKRVPGNQPTHSNVIVFLPFRGMEDCTQSVARFEQAFTPVGYIHRGNGMHA